MSNNVLNTNYYVKKPNFSYGTLSECAFGIHPPPSRRYRVDMYNIVLVHCTKVEILDGVQLSLGPLGKKLSVWVHF